MNPTPTSAGSSPPDAGSDPPQPPHRRHSRFPATARWTLVFIVVIIAMVVAIWPRGDDPAPSGADDGVTATGPRATDAQVDDAQLAKARQEADLPACPTTGAPVSPQSALAGITVPCLSDGSAYDIGAATAGKPLVINMWAVWCLPCRHELPEMAAYAERAGDKLDVVAVHAQEGARNPYLVLQFLIENGVRLPVVLDTDAKVAGALGAPRVFPSTILVRADGTVAKVLPQIFDDPDEVAAAVQQYLGVAT
ncbi:TlpA disulfide reductase family protein [Gordonia sp. CPCC 206044]|uniref:redoxin family protein n=1 Tax=Gordonia sp. CPCC 206044 TaxID=3140793 RepID=UPI003AF347F3